MKTISWTTICNDGAIEASAPCRVDMGGTLDLGTFHYPLRHLDPCTFNIALNLRTRVRLGPYTAGRIRIDSRGVGSAEFEADRAPFDHPLGLMFAVAAHFNATGIHIRIDSASPPKSALGGSSVAAVALAAALAQGAWIAGQGPPPSRRRTACAAHGIESAVAGVPCGMQDQLAAAYGGVNVWHWEEDGHGRPWRRQALGDAASLAALSSRMLVAYCGIPHESKNVNGTWVRQFLSGDSRDHWQRIVAATHAFVTAFEQGDVNGAAAAMNLETRLRRELTPEVLDDMGTVLVADAEATGCGARFTGAGGGGCIWALGEPAAIDHLRGRWETRLEQIPAAGLLDAHVDGRGLLINEQQT
jgi:D-glycero-alpha-D-manno-heptose-7-phosphate kinase